MDQASRTPPPTESAKPKPSERRFNLPDFLARFAPLIFLVLLAIIFGLLQPRFWLPLNLWNVMRQVSITGLLAIGMTFVILTAGIDLSVGSLLAFAGLVCADLYKGGEFILQHTGINLGFLEGSVLAAALSAVLIGVLGGLLQGSAVTRMRVPPFVVTLGGLSAFRGAALFFSNGGPISGFDEAFNFWGQGRVINNEVPVPVIIFLGAALVAHIVLRYTRYGRHVYAVGGNEEAARLSGLNTGRIKLSVYVIVGFMAGLGGFVLASRLNSAEAVAGVSYELTVIAAVVIGGTSLFGGEGGVLGTVVGAVLVGVLTNGLVLMNVSSYIQQIIIGVIIVVAVWFDQFIKSRRTA
ncbi:MAG: ABC transporter permease [Chloroflexi bacterium]|nr:ABC transporter permease [Chloroflexota bacterium]